MPAMILTVCSQPAQEQGSGLSDPSSEQALQDQITIDPDLANRNDGEAAPTMGGNTSIPPENRTPEAIADAKNEAFVLVGRTGGMRELPAPMTRNIPLYGPPGCRPCFPPIHAERRKTPPAPI
ncbi:MAG: hypothetical protein WA948_02595 [Pontixanthobacter sp.]